MSLRQVFRSKFGSDKDKESPEGQRRSLANDNKATLEYSDSTQSSRRPSTSKEQKCDSYTEGSCGSLSDSMSDLTPQQLYEVQLTQLQEQLVAAMIENQSLNAELHTYKDEHQMGHLFQELEIQRDRNKQLKQHIMENEKKQMQQSVHNGNDPAELTDEVDQALEATESLHDIRGCSPSQPKAWLGSFQEWLVSIAHEYLADFTEDPEPEAALNPEGDPLTVKKLKDNIKRFKNGAKPLFRTAKAMRRVVTWKTPSLTLIIFIIYMYSVWHGWLLPVILLACITQLTINYFSYRGWNINVALLAEVEEEEKESETFKDLGMSDKFNLVLQVARQVQDTLGKIADNLEKIKNLFLWKHPEATLSLYLSLCLAMLLACVLPGMLLFRLAALVLGFKMFVVELIYHRFPRFKQRHDTVNQLWRSLPTDAELERRYQRVVVDRNLLFTEEMPVPRGEYEVTISQSRRQFCELFQLPCSEGPLSGWEQGRRCTLINKEKTLGSAFKHGRLYLTNSFLCFERSRTVSCKNFIIPLAEVMKVVKAKPYTWMPGAGMSIEITMQQADKCYMFGALLNRDECFDAIMACGATSGLPWSSKPGPASVVGTSDQPQCNTTLGNLRYSAKTGSMEEIMDSHSSLS